MSRVLVTGASTGIGLAAVHELLGLGHEVLAHARNGDRPLPDGAEPVLGDLSETARLPELAARVGAVDTVIHNAGVLRGPELLAVNVLAPYALGALIPAERMIVISSSMHRGGSASSIADLDGIDYSDSKLLVTMLAAAIARRGGTSAQAVDPGWVPTRMGGSSASDDLLLGHRTQALLADGSLAAPAGFSYWFHERRQQPHPAVLDAAAQDALLDALAQRTGVPPRA